MVYKWSRITGNIDRSLQNDDGHTVLMLAAIKNCSGIFKALLESDTYYTGNTALANFALKNRKDGDKTVLDYAQGRPEVEEVIAKYDKEYKKRIVKEASENSDLIPVLSAIVAEYATPVNPDDIEADRAYVQEQWWKEMDQKWIELETRPM